MSSDSRAAPFSVQMHRGGDEICPDSIIYATTHRDEACEFGAPALVNVTFERPLHVEHTRGVSWRARIEQITGHANWAQALGEYDGIVYSWPASTHWKTGLPVPARQWAIGAPGTITKN